MDTELKCNRLTCRKSLTDKAVVTTCSHIFCVECANELFNAARLCPACEASLTEPDDVVVCSLHPTNDYKTSVLSGLAPSTILEICSRAISFWQYQIYQESSFQQAVVRSLTDKSNQAQKQLDSVVREANNEIALLNNKIGDLERDIELERRKVRDLQENARDRDREYQKLKTQHDKMKRKALLGTIAGSGEDLQPSAQNDRQARGFGGNVGNVDVGAVVGGMEANGIQRTPLVNRAASGQHQNAWSQQQLQHQQRRHRQSMPANGYRSGNVSDTSSTREVETMLGSGGGGSAGSGGNRRSSGGGFGGGWGQRVGGQGQRVFPAGNTAMGSAMGMVGAKRSGTFRPSGMGNMR